MFQTGKSAYAVQSLYPAGKEVAASLRPDVPIFCWGKVYLGYATTPGKEERQLSAKGNLGKHQRSFHNSANTVKILPNAASE